MSGPDNATLAATRRRFDFSKLDSPISTAGMTAEPTPKNQINAVLELLIEEIEEDPNQPRQEFPEESLAELAADIKRRKVQQPIKVRPRDPMTGKYRIIHGARRYRASILAEKTTIPAIVEIDEKAYDAYSQVTENTQREALNALDIAAFIKTRQQLGESNKVIAEGLSVSLNFVTRHAALLDAPEHLQEAFKAGRINGVDVAYELSKLHDTNPDAVVALLSDEAEAVITRTMVRAARNPAPINASIEADTPVRQEATAVASAVEPTTDNTGADVTPHTPATTETASVLSSDPPAPENFVLVPFDPATAQPSEPSATTVATAPANVTENATEAPEAAAKVVQVPFHNPALDAKKEPAPVDPNKIKKPLLLGKHADREIKVLLQRAPSAVGLIHIQYEDTMEEAEVSIGEVILSALFEMRSQEKG